MLQMLRFELHHPKNIKLWKKELLFIVIYLIIHKEDILIQIKSYLQSQKSISHFKLYPLGIHFLLRTDHLAISISYNKKFIFKTI